MRPAAIPQATVSSPGRPPTSMPSSALSEQRPRDERGRRESTSVRVCRARLRTPRGVAGHPLGHVGLRRGVGLDPDRLGRDADVHVIGAHVLGGHRDCADHRVASDPDAGEHRRVIGDPHVVLEHRPGVGHVLLIHDAVGVAVDVGVVRDAHPVAQRDPAPVVQQDVAVHHAVVAHLHVVAVRELHEVEALEVPADAREEMLREHPAEPDPDMHVLPPRAACGRSSTRASSSGFTRA